MALYLARGAAEWLAAFIQGRLAATLFSLI